MEKVKNSQAKKAKIVARIVGGIGNQLFIYSAARRLALMNDADLVLDHFSGFVRDYRYQRQYELDHFQIPCRKAESRERLEPFSRLRRCLKRQLNRHRSFPKRSYIVQEGDSFDPRLLELRPAGTIHLEGYWQSEGYFKDVEDTIRKDLGIIPPVDEVNVKMAELIQSRPFAVAVHVRFFEQPRARGGLNAPADYYRAAVAEMARRVPKAHYFLFSDKPEAALEKLGLPDNKATLVKHNSADFMAYADLWLMTKCQHFIIANSTFSWWGAWLSNTKNKHVIAPKLERSGGGMSWGFKGLLPEAWIKC